MTTTAPPKITLDLAKLPGESPIDRLHRVGNADAKPIKPEQAIAGVAKVGPAPLTEEQVTAMREESLDRLRPKRAEKRGKR